MPEKERLTRQTGLAHLFAAAGYSLAGLRRLMRENAFRQELALILGLGALFWVAGASWAALGGLLALGCLLFAVEALNTAIEVLVDHLSPDWSQWAKESKDLGSFAVGAVLAGIFLYAGIVLFA